MVDGIDAGDALKFLHQGNAHFEHGELDTAIQSYRHGLDAAPHHAALHYNLGNALLRRGRPVESIEQFLACLQARPDFTVAYVNLAEALRGLGLLDQALWAARTAWQLLPDHPEACTVLANTLHDRSEYEAAEREYRRALDLVPDHPGVLSSLGNTLHAMGRLAEALSLHDRAVAAAPQDADFRYNRAATRLAAGDYTRGWSDYEWRLLRAQARSRNLGPAWYGEDIAGRTILLHAEQGLGDTLQFVRYARLVAARGAHVVLEVQPPLVALMRSLAGPEKVIASGDPPPPFDAHCPLLSLPHVLKTTLQTVPAQVPYLCAGPSAIEAWAKRLPEDDRLRIGVVWAGSSHRDDAGWHQIDRRRSTTREAFAALADVPGIHLVSLQKPERGEAPAPSANFRLIDLMADVTDFADTAALIANLDLVISVDTSVAHLAGALGQPVWLLSRSDGCWRWLHDRNDSPWYPLMRIYRQSRPYDWSGVIARVRHDLMAWARANGRPSAAPAG